MNNDRKDKKIEAEHIKALRHAIFNEGFKHIVKLKEEDIEPLIDPETGERRTYAVIGAAKIKQK